MLRMIETVCKDCGQRYRLGTDHVCPKKRPAKKSTAARKDVPKAPAPDRPMQGAGTQAPPVDLTTRGTPRKRAPKGTFDRKAYQRAAAKQRRARLAEKAKSP